jgi:hypothetical protein
MGWPTSRSHGTWSSFGALRASRGDPEAALEPDELADRWEEELADLAVTGSLRTMVLHPFLMLDERWSACVARLLGFVAELARERRTWVVAGDAFADWLHGSKAALRS